MSRDPWQKTKEMILPTSTFPLGGNREKEGERKEEREREGRGGKKPREEKPYLLSCLRGK